MQAVRLARYHTGRRRISSASPVPIMAGGATCSPGSAILFPRATRYTLADLSERTLKVLATPRRHRLRARQPAPGDAPERRPRPAIRRWSTARAAPPSIARPMPNGWRRLREVCTETRHRPDLRRGVRRLPPRAAAAHRSISAFRPTSSPMARRWAAACRSACSAAAQRLMKRFRERLGPADICFARGTFNSHPYVMGAMNAFLKRLDTPEIARLYEGLDDLWDGRAALLNGRLAGSGPAGAASPTSRRSGPCSTTRPSRYNWMLQYLSACRGAGAELGRHRPADLQPEL